MFRFLIPALAPTFILCCCARTEPGRDDLTREPTKAREATLVALAGRHGADLKWRKPFEDHTRPQTYTYEFQKALVKPDGQPVVLIGFLDDVIMLEDGRYELRGRDSVIYGPDVYISLKCSVEQVAPLLKAAPGFLDELAFVARVTGVSRPMFQVSAETESADSTPHAVVEPSGTVFVEGQCLEILRLED